MPTQLFTPIEILLIENNPTDVLLSREALTDAKITNTLSVVENGVAALDFLHRRGEYANAPRPDLIILDLNLPRKNGREVLAEIKTDADLKIIPIVVLTTSSTEDIINPYGLDANCYIIKPMNFSSFVQVIKDIEHFWGSVVAIPSEHNHA
jgi:two-component system, chemotaxis family, response regulator Rcp1